MTQSHVVHFTSGNTSIQREQDHMGPEGECVAMRVYGVGRRMIEWGGGGWSGEEGDGVGRRVIKWGGG